MFQHDHDCEDPYHHEDHYHHIMFTTRWTSGSICKCVAETLTEKRVLQQKFKHLEVKVASYSHFRSKKEPLLHQKLNILPIESSNYDIILIR